MFIRERQSQIWEQPKVTIYKLREDAAENQADRSTMRQSEGICLLLSLSLPRYSREQKSSGVKTSTKRFGLFDLPLIRCLENTSWDPRKKWRVVSLPAVNKSQISSNPALHPTWGVPQ
jgi:hypothetical protein